MGYCYLRIIEPLGSRQIRVRRLLASIPDYSQIYDGMEFSYAPVLSDRNNAGSITLNSFNLLTVVFKTLL